MLGTIVNSVGVIIGSCIGLMLKKGIPEHVADTIMKGLGMCTVLLGLEGALAGGNSLVIIISVVVGAAVGEAAKLDDRMNELGRAVEAKVNRGHDGKVSIAAGFVNATILFCAGSMAIMGSLDAGLTGDYSTLFNKTMLDFCSSIIYSSSMGIGVMFSSVVVFFYQGAITLLAHAVSQFLSDAVVLNLSCVGSLLIVFIGLNLSGITKFKVMNYMPAVLVPVIIGQFIAL